MVKVDRWLTWVRANKHNTKRRFELHRNAFTLTSEQARLQNPPSISKPGLSSINSSGSVRKTKKNSPLESATKQKKTVFQYNVEEWIRNQQKLGEKLPEMSNTFFKVKRPRGRPRKSDVLSKINLKRLPQDTTGSFETQGEISNSLDKRYRIDSGDETVRLEDQTLTNPAKKAGSGFEPRSRETQSLSQESFESLVSPSLPQSDNYSYLTSAGCFNYDIYDQQQHLEIQESFNHSRDIYYCPETNRGRGSNGSSLMQDISDEQWENTLPLSLNRQSTTCPDSFQTLYHSQFSTEQNQHCKI